jgi:hypothetical protein
MHGTLRLLAAAVLLLQAAACASTPALPDTESSYRADLGRATARVLDDELPRRLNRYNYVLLRREDRESSLYYETEWNRRDLMADEVELGYQSAETRIIVEARRSGEVFRVEFVAENRLRRAPGYDWEEIPMTPMFKEYIGRIARELQREISSRL